MAPSPLSSDLLLFRLNKLASLTGQPLVRICEGHYGITRREWRMIMTLGRDGPLLSGELAQRARIEPARTSRAVTLLVEKGLALRTPRAHDRRYVEIGLTPEGQDIFETLFPVVKQLNTSLLSAFSAQEQALFDALLSRLEERAVSWMVDAELPKADRRRLRTARAKVAP